ncbi:MAG: MFS transporter [Gammaproteobacteria bacterium]|nr:MFS transporter [Gammaproteobacteria bacterium]
MAQSEAKPGSGPVAPGTATTERKPLTKWVLASYAAPATPLALAGLPIGVYLPVVYADSDGFGLSLAVVAILITLSRFTDVITDPLIGFLSDRLRTRWGRRKPFVLLGTPIYALGMWLLFIAPDGFEDMTFLGWTFSTGYPWMFCMMSLLYLGSTIKDLPYSAWGAELSRNYNERTLVMSWREGFAVAGSLISAFIPAVILFFGYTKPTDAVYILVMGMCILMPVLVANALITVPEYPVIERSRERVKLLAGLKVVANNKPYRYLVIIFAFSSIGAAMTNSLSFFFVKHVLVAGELYGLYLAPYFVCQIAAIPLWFKLSRKIGKHRATMVAIGWYALWASFLPLIAISPAEWYTAFRVEVILAFLPTETYQTMIVYFEGIETGKFLFFIIIMCLKGSSIGALSALPSAMAADVIDVDTAETGKQRAGAYFSIWSMVRKAAYALGVTIGLTLAVVFGFDSLADPRDTTNTTSSLIWLACIYSVIPALFKFIGMPLLWKYPLTEEKVRSVQAEIERKKQEAAAAST